MDPLHLGLDGSEKIMFVVAGCNGAGKTTAFKESLHETLGSPEFINPDEIAVELCPSDVEKVKNHAGRLTVERIQACLAGHSSFCVETTLATRTYQGHIREAHKNGFKVALFYYWLDSPDLAVARVEQRVSEGGHHVPESVIRTRYDKSVRYLSTLYLPQVDYWKIVDNSGILQKEIATSVTVVNNRSLYNSLMCYGKGDQNQ